MFIFIALAIGSFIIIAGSFLFGHDHDTDHADVGHGGDGHDLSHDMEPTISFFSVKVIATLIMGFGAAGAIARQYGADYVVASLIGLASGGVLSLLMYGMLNLIYKQQSSSLVDPGSAIGRTGVVQTSIGVDTPGEVSLDVGGQYMTFLARSSAGTDIPKGRTVKVVSLAGTQLVVEDAHTN